jgi:hypothetical protein
MKQKNKPSASSPEEPWASLGFSIEADEAFYQRREWRLSQAPLLHNGAKVPE